MDRAIEHSDSDSGESWTLLDDVPVYADEVPEFPDVSSVVERDGRESAIEKDEDTDGISIISDSEPESPSPHEANDDDGHPDLDKPPSIPMPASRKLDDEIMQESLNGDFLGDSNGKHKTYVHRRNKRLSTVLNIIVLGSVITAAGVAIGHMWGAKHDCAVNNIPSVNKILSNLYKLQEENAYLRSKLKELTQINLHTHQRKSGTESTPKQNKCKKIFEDSIHNLNSVKPVKCIDNDENSITGLHLVESEQEKPFLQDINTLKDIYKQNKSWLDQEVAVRLKDMQNNNLKNKVKTKSDKYKKNKQEEHLGTIHETATTGPKSHDSDIITPNMKGDFPTYTPSERKISYADSLKSEPIVNRISKIEVTIERNENKEHKKKNKKDLDDSTGYTTSEEEFKKDNRYVEQKHKQDRKKYDRKKIHKKQKRKNKYEQWEMKGGYLKDYDDFSISSWQENDHVVKNLDKSSTLSMDIERENHIEQFLEIENTNKVLENSNKNVKTKLDKIKNGKNERNGLKNKDKEITWFEKRALLRNEARKKLEHELFGETSSNNAGWYFRRMQRREQCRAKGDNSTYRKLSKHNMNFKTKH